MSEPTHEEVADASASLLDLFGPAEPAVGVAPASPRVDARSPRVGTEPPPPGSARALAADEALHRAAEQSRALVDSTTTPGERKAKPRGRAAKEDKSLVVPAGADAVGGGEAGVSGLPAVVSDPAEDFLRSLLPQSSSARQRAFKDLLRAVVQEGRQR